VLARSANHVRTISYAKCLRKEVLLELLVSNRGFGLAYIKHIVTRQPQFDIVRAVLFAQVFNHLMIQYVFNG